MTVLTIDLDTSKPFAIIRCPCGKRLVVGRSKAEQGLLMFHEDPECTAIRTRAPSDYFRWLRENGGEPLGGRSQDGALYGIAAGPSN